MSVLDGFRAAGRAVYNGHATVGEALLRRPGAGFYLIIIMISVFVQPVAVFLLACLLAAVHRGGGVR